jgi:hypothetical protein
MCESLQKKTLIDQVNFSRIVGLKEHLEPVLILPSYEPRLVWDEMTTCLCCLIWSEAVLFFCFLSRKLLDKYHKCPRVVVMRHIHHNTIITFLKEIFRKKLH